MNNNGKKKAIEFVKKYKFYKPSLKELYKIFNAQGYVLIEFNALDNDIDVENILTSLSLTGYIYKTRAFTYTDSNYRLVFVNEDLSDEEKLNVLLHEQGHIFCNHVVMRDVIGEDVKHELEANTFADCVLKQPFSLKIRKNKAKIICSFIALCLIVAGAFGIFYAVEESKYYKNYYLTETGFKYHTDECGYVHDKTNVRRMTKDDFNSGDYEPCMKCID